jgi:TolB-like protein/DNA-binding winged helix-turn-helix (wHTH) protein
LPNAVQLQINELLLEDGMESGGSSPGIRPVIEFADFRLDPQQRKLFRLDGTPLALNSRAFDTLLTLVDHRGEVLSKHQLLNAVWPRVVVEENNLNQAISALRKTLRDSETNRIILTVPGRGFCFVAEIRNVTDNNARKGPDNLVQEIRSNLGSPVSAMKSESASLELLDLEAPQASQIIADSATSMRKFSGLSWKRHAVLAIVAFIIVFAGLAAWIRTPEPVAKSIAVLPFTNLSDDPEQDYFSDGLTDELINKLSQVDDLVVTGRNSSFYFKGRDDELRDIGQQLDVTYLLQGSVRKAGNRLRITAQLMNVETNANLWSQNFEREIADIFSIQDEISAAVTTALSVTLRAGEFSQPGMTSNVESYEEFLQGQKLQRDFTNGAITLPGAIENFERAVQLDPAFAEGWVRLADVYRLGILRLPSDQTVDFAALLDNAMARAEALAPALPSLVLSTALQKAQFESKYAEAEALFRSVLDNSGGNNGRAAVMFGTFLWATGRAEEGLSYSRQARRLDPKDPEISLFLTNLLLNQGRFDEALAESERGVALGSNAINLAGARLIAAMTRQDRDAAVAALQGVAMNPAYLEIASLWQSGDDAATLAAVRKFVDASTLTYAELRMMRQWAAALGDDNLVIELLNRSTGMPADIWLALYADARRLPGFKDYMRNIGLLDYWRTTDNWGDYCRPLEGNNDFECF